MTTVFIALGLALCGAPAWAVFIIAVWAMYIEREFFFK